MGGELRQWRDCRLGDVLELKRGYDLPSQHRHPGPVPIVSSSGPSGFHSEAMVKAPGVVTGRYGTIGEVFFVTQDFWPLNTTLYVRDFKGSDPKFVSYFLKTIDFYSCSDKAAVPGVNRNHLHELPVRVPPLAEQRAIARILGALDDKIELNRKMNRTLEAMAQALFKSWFIDFDGVADSDLVESEFGPIPKGWRTDQIGNVVSVVGGSTPSTKEPRFWEKGHHCWTTPKDLSSATCPLLLETERRISDAGLAKISSGLLPVGTFLLSSRAPVGYTAISRIPVAVNQGYIAIPPGGTLDAYYLLHWTRANLDTIKGRAGGTTFQEISKRNFRPIQIIVPDKAKLSSFTRAVEPLFARIENAENQTTTLATLRDTLLPKLISGEVRVPEAETAVEAVL